MAYFLKRDDDVRLSSTIILPPQCIFGKNDLLSLGTGLRVDIEPNSDNLEKFTRFYFFVEEMLPITTIRLLPILQHLKNFG